MKREKNKICFYAIYQLSTKLFVPSGGKRLGGHTKQEPTSDRPPRLHNKEKDARLALRCYLMGKWYEHSYTDSYTGEWESDGPEPRKETKRDEKDFVVVKLELVQRV